MPTNSWSLSHPVLHLADRDCITLGDLCESVLIMGGIGSGKTSGSGATLLRALLRLGAGVCCLAGKQDEYERIYRLCHETNRLKDLVYFAPGQPWRCDVLDYSLQGPGASVEAAAQLIDILVETEHRQRPSGGDSFWRDFSANITRQAIIALWLGQQHASLSDVYRFVTSAPQSVEDVNSDLWADHSYCAQILVKAKYQAHSTEQQLALQQCADFWLREWPQLSDKTRTSGQIVLTTTLSKFLSAPLQTLLSSGSTNLPPTVILDGKIVVLGMPTSHYHGPGRFFQIAYKTLFQRTALARDLHQNNRPIVLWQDEVQNFLNPGLDLLFQTMGRQSRLITVSLGHSLPVLYASLGGTEQARHEIDGWVAQHMLKFLHANACHSTNEYFSQLMGRRKQLLHNGSLNHGQYDWYDDFLNLPSKSQVTSGWSENWEPNIQPHEFTRLPKGGAANGFRVGAYLHAGGKRFAHGKTYLRVTFKQ